MALTKLPKNALGTGSVDASKIEDGTIQNQELAGSLSEDKLATGTIENASLSNSTITINGTSISLGGSTSIGVEVNWQSVQTGDFTAVASKGYFVNTTSAAVEVTLPASASLGDQIAIKDYAGTFASNNLTIGRNGHNIQGVANDSLISTNRASLLLVYVDATKGWIYVEESNVGDLGQALFTSATGGTVTESGDYKIHTFTGDGCFVVATAGNSPIIPTGGPSNVDYLVVAGGGGGNAIYGGGGGAGGYRATGFGPSPLRGSALGVSVGSYTITVGAGGASNTVGTSSIFSTITSAGGGKGNCAGASGGGGHGDGGAGVPANNPRSGNTPPTSPPQGNNSGTGWNENVVAAGGGGGGAGGVGGNASSGQGGTGGVGVPNAITGSAVSYNGGGGGGATTPSTGGNASPCGTGGAGGGSSAGAAGTTNRGGGGGAGGGDGGGARCGNAGGSGIVIIRYKFQ